MRTGDRGRPNTGRPRRRFLRAALTLLASTFILGLFAGTAHAETLSAGDEPNIGDGPVTTGQNIDDRIQPPGPSSEDVWLEDLENPSGTASPDGAGIWWEPRPTPIPEPKPTPEPSPEPEPTPEPAEGPNPGPRVDEIAAQATVGPAATGKETPVRFGRATTTR